MFRLRRTSLLLPLVALAAPFSGCRTMYRDVYSPQHNYYVPPVEKQQTMTLPEEKPKAVTMPDATNPAPPPAAPPSAPTIPGLEAPPGGMAPMPGGMTPPPPAPAPAAQ